MSTRTVNPVAARSSASAQDTELLKVIAGANSISVTIPEGATLADIEKSLGVAITAYKRLSEAGERLKPIIGRILLEVRRRGLYKASYRNFTEYVRKHVGEELGLGPTNAFDALKIARAFPSLSEEEYHRIGASRLLLASRVTDETKEGFQSILDQAKQAPTVEAFKEVVNDLRQHEPKSTALKPVVALRVTEENKARWEAICADDPTRDRGEIFGDMMDLYVVRDQLTRKLPTRENVRARSKVG